MNCGKFNNRTEHAIIVNTVSLFESLCASLVTVNQSIGLPFDFIHPLTVNEVPTRWRNQSDRSYCEEKNTQIALLPSN
jgi:hypothetical protein